jgi:hypothetical protein
MARIYEAGSQEAAQVVWDNLYMAEVFTKKAAEGGARDIPLRWCLIIAAAGLWSAVVIFNKEVASGNEKLGTSASEWFKKNEKLVHQIRNRAVHNSQPQGVGQSVTVEEGASKSTLFVWVLRQAGDTEYEETPIEDVLSRLTRVRERIEQHVLATTGRKYMNFG